MKIVRNLALSFPSFGVISFVLLLLVTAMYGQSNAPRPTRSATAQIPYDFWVEGTLLPAGDYTLSRIEETVVVFRNSKADAQEEAFLLPTGDRVADTDHKLIFIVHEGRHYLRGVWDGDGRQVITSQLDVPLAPGDEETQVPLVEPKRDSHRPNKAVIPNPDRSPGSAGETSK
jgi:hypothetical protein